MAKKKNIATSENGVKKIHETINAHKKLVSEKGYEVLFIGLIGSQNYNLQGKDSDIDTFCVVKPKKYQLTRKISFDVQLDDAVGFESICYVKDIFTFVEGLNKGSIKNLEVLKTRYFHGRLPGSIGRIKPLSIPKRYIYNYQTGKINMFKSKGDKVDLFHALRADYYLGLDEVKDFEINQDAKKDVFVNLKANLDSIELEEFPNRVNYELSSEFLDKNNDISVGEDSIYEYLHQLDEVDIQKREFQVFVDTYTVITNQQRLESNRKELFSMLNVYRGDVGKIKEFDFKNPESLKTTPSDVDNVDKAYRAYKKCLEMYLNRVYEYSPYVFDKHIEFAKERDILNYQNIVFIPIDFYQKFIQSPEFINFVNKNKVDYDLDDVPGFYEKLDLKTGEWNVRMRFIDNAVLVFNEFNGKYVNIQTRQLSDDYGNHKYVNFSSSKKRGRLYQHGRKTYQGIASFGDIENAETILLTEGHFKALHGYKLCKDKDRYFGLYGEFPDLDATIALPGLNINSMTLEVLKGKSILLAFDNDVVNGSKSTIKQYEKLKQSLIYSGVEIIGELPVKEKLDDDILLYNKKIKKES